MSISNRCDIIKQCQLLHIALQNFYVHLMYFQCTYIQFVFNIHQYLQTDTLSYPKSRDAFTSKNIKVYLLNIWPWMTIIEISFLSMCQVNVESIQYEGQLLVDNADIEYVKDNIIIVYLFPPH